MTTEQQLFNPSKQSVTSRCEGLLVSMIDRVDDVGKSKVLTSMPST